MRTKIGLFAAFALLLPAVASAFGINGSPAGLFNLFSGPGYLAVGGILSFVMENMDWPGLVWSVLKMMALSFVLALIVLFCCRKTRIFKRRNKVWDKLTYLYYILIPVVMLVASVGISAPAHVGTMAENLIAQGLVPVVDSAMNKTVQSLPPGAQEALQESPELFFKKAMQGVLNEEATTPAGNFVQQGAVSVWQAIGEISQDWLAGLAASIVADRLGINSDTFKAGVKVIYKNDLLKSVSGLGTVLGAMATHKIWSMIRSVQLMLLLIPVGLLLIPVLDVFIARRLEKRADRQV
jgi:hypothetical protein